MAAATGIINCISILRLLCLCVCVYVCVYVCVRVCVRVFVGTLTSLRLMRECGDVRADVGGQLLHHARSPVTIGVH